MSNEAEAVYLDHAATTPVDAAVAEAMSRCLAAGAVYGNPSSIHAAGRRAYAAIEDAREAVARLLNAPPRCLIFTSGATEADNLALIGGARFRAHRGRHLITMTTEHKAVLGAAEALENEGFEVTRLSPDPDGVLRLDALADALRADTQIVSIMHVNNETGVMQDIAGIGALCREHDILFHTDAAQSVGKLPLDLETLPVDLLSLTAHKLHGPQGIGALYIADRPGCGVRPLFFGGAQERRLRPGTEPLAAIVGFGVAARLARQHMEADRRHRTALCDRLWAGLSDLPGIRRNGSGAAHFAGILNVSMAGIEGESLMLALEPLSVASGSACNSTSGEASFVLKALGLSDDEAQSAIRFSFGRGTTIEDVDVALECYRRAIAHLRRIAPPAEAAA